MNKYYKKKKFAAVALGYPIASAVDESAANSNALVTFVATLITRSFAGLAVPFPKLRNPKFLLQSYQFK